MKFGEDVGVKMVSGSVEESFGSEMDLLCRRASHRLI